MPRGKPSPTTGAKKKRKPCVKRSYTDYERQQAVGLAKAIGMSAAAETLGIPRDTVVAWASGWRSEKTLHLYSLTDGDVAKLQDAMAWDQAAIARERMDKATYSELINGMTKCLMNARIVRGETTVNIKSESTNVNATIDVAKLTAEQRNALRQLIALATVEPAAIAATEQQPGHSGLPGETGRVRPVGVANLEPGS